MQGCGVEVGGLDEDGGFGVADAGEPGFVLGNEDVGIFGCAEGRTRDERDGHGVWGGNRDIGGEFFARGNLGTSGWEGLLAGNIELPICSFKERFFGFGGVGRLHSGDLRGQVRVVVWVAGHVLGELGGLAFTHDLLLFASRSSVHVEWFSNFVGICESACCCRDPGAGQGCFERVTPCY